MTEYLARLSLTSDLEPTLTAARAGTEVVATGLERALDVFFEADADPVIDIDYPGSWTAPGRRISHPGTWERGCLW